MGLRTHVVVQAHAIVQGLSNVASQACGNMANTTRERTVKYIMGGRKPDNPFEQNVILKNGKYRKSSVARPWPGSPRSYKKPGNPKGCLAVVRYAKKGTSRTPVPPIFGVGGFSVGADTFITGPIGNGDKNTPRKLELGGPSTSYYKIIRNKKGEVARWEFFNKKPKPVKKKASWNMRGGKGPHSRDKDGTLKYASWAEVNAAMRARGQKVGGKRISKVAQPSIDPTKLGYLGPKTFHVRPRPYVSRAWNQVKKRSKTFVKKAAMNWTKETKKYLAYIGG